MEDDTVLSGKVDVSSLHDLLTRDATAVEYIRLNMMPDCFHTGAGKPLCKRLGCIPPDAVSGVRMPEKAKKPHCPGSCYSSELHPPCIQHARSPLLHSTHRWSDRPHFATLNSSAFCWVELERADVRDLAQEHQAGPKEQ